MKRRTFISNSIKGGVLLSAGSLLSCTNQKIKTKVLVLGGTNFVGPAIVNEALLKGYEVTLFNRGITNPKLFPELRLIKGDRLSGPSAYEPLLDEKWDIIIDVWPEKSVLVEEALSQLKDQTNHYIFISSIAVYNDFQEVGLHEESDVVSLELSQENWGYSEEKLAAENAVKSHFPVNHTILRPGAITGWRDPALNLLYWCIKLNRDDAIIAPGSGLDPIQFIDVKDVGKFTISAAQNKHLGIYNCIGPNKEPLLWNEFLENAKSNFNSSTELIWADESFLSENNIASFSDLPLWAPLSEDRGFMQISNQKVNQTGFEYSELGQTLDDCMEWLQTHIENKPEFGTETYNLGLNRAKELELIQKISG